MGRRLRVFVSHSSHAPDARAWLEAFVSDLGQGEDQVEVLVDKELITGGDRWRAVINVMLAECDAAVVLITPDALASSWVLKEATILRFRHDQGSGFPLLPVVQDIGPDELKHNRLWDPVDLPELQFLTGDGAAEAAAAIKKKLAPLARQNRQTPLDLLAADIAFKLKTTESDRIQYALDELSETIPFQLGDKQRCLAYAIARWMIRQSPPALMRVAEALTRLGNTFPTTDAREILNLVAPIWVDLDAASWFVRANCQHSDFRDIAIACRQPDPTLRQFIDRAYMPDSSPLFRQLNGVTGGAHSDDIARELRAVVRPELEINRPLNDAEIDEKLSQLNTRIYVALPLPYDRQVVTALQTRFQRITFVFFAAPEDCPPNGDPPLAAGVRWVDPPIESGLEDKVCRDFVNAWLRFPSRR